MQGAPRRQVNAEDMLAELKRALESSTHAPDAPPPSASTAPKSSSPGRETGRSQIDNGSGRPAKANADKSTGPRTDLQKSTRPSSRSWKLIAGRARAGGRSRDWCELCFHEQTFKPAEREPTVAATEGPVGRKTNKLRNPQAPPERRCRTASRLRLASRQLGDAARRTDSSAHRRFAFSCGKSGSRRAEILPLPA